MFRALSRLIVALIGVVSLGSASCGSPTAPADTQVPFGGYMVLTGNPADYIEIPHSVSLNPTSGITLEGWVKFDTVSCESLIGKDFTAAFWVGACPQLRSYLRGSASSLDGGTFPTGAWTHWAVTSDGVTRRHYLNAVLVGEFPDAGLLTTSTAPLRIGSDISWQFCPKGALDEIRLWNVARTQAQIQSTMNTAISSPQTGLVAVWPLDTDGRSVVGSFNGTVIGAPQFIH